MKKNEKRKGDLLYSGGFPAVTITHPSGTLCFPKTLYCKNCNIDGASVSDKLVLPVEELEE